MENRERNNEGIDTKEGLSVRETVRAAWVVRDEIESPAAVEQVVQRAVQLGLNTLIVQVRGRGVAYYRSDIEPWHPSLRAFDYDPLALLLDKAAAVDIEVHAWINALYTWSESRENLPEGHVLQLHPEWAMADVSGRSALDFTSAEFKAAQPLEGTYLCPSWSEVRAYLSSVYAEVARRYQVAGVHLDYIRYASPKFCFCQHCMNEFANMQGLSAERLRTAWQENTVPANIRSAYDDWRRSLVTATMVAVHDAVRQAAPHKLITAAVFPGKEDAYRQRFQDWAGWAQQGYIDGLFPMAYSPDTPIVRHQLEHMLESVPQVPVVAGIGAYKQTPESALEKIRIAQSLGAKGFCLFAMKSLAPTDWDVITSA